jgi:hypothetical protein
MQQTFQLRHLQSSWSPRPLQSARSPAGGAPGAGHPGSPAPVHQGLACVCLSTQLPQGTACPQSQQGPLPGQFLPEPGSSPFLVHLTHPRTSAGRNPGFSYPELFYLCPGQPWDSWDSSLLTALPCHRLRDMSWGRAAVPQEKPHVLVSSTGALPL